MADTDERIWAEVAAMKRGASDVVERLRTMVNEGAPSIAELSYTIRLHEKEDAEIVEKIATARRNNPNFSTNEIRDIVEMRILTLSRLDALDIIPRVVEAVRERCSSATALFVSSEIATIDIHCFSKQVGSHAFPQRVTSLLDFLGVRTKCNLIEANGGIASIDLAVWCRGRFRDFYERVPVRIQIRTAMEDTWAELEHRLKYRSPGQPIPLRDEAILQQCITHLNVMKTFIDGASQYADQILAEATSLSSRRFMSTTHKFTQDIDALIESMTLSPDVKQSMERALTNQRFAMAPNHRRQQYAEARLKNLQNALREFVAVAKILEREVKGGDGQDIFSTFYLPLEIALCYFQIGIELQFERSALAEAARIYQTVQDKYPFSATVRYRYGRTLAGLGDFEAAIKKLQEARALLEEDRDEFIGARHWLRVSVPRNLGFYYWELAEKIRRDPLSQETNEKSNSSI